MSMTPSPVTFLTRRFGALDGRIYILGLGWLVTSAGFAMVIPFISIYFHQEMGLSMTAIGLFFGFTAILRAVPQPAAGWLSDKIGRVPVMGWSQILRSVTFVAIGYAIAAKSGFMTIAVIISFNYVFGAVLNPAANAMVADLVPREQRISAYALLRVGNNLGWALGPALGGFVSAKSYSALFYLAGLMALISGIVFLTALKDVPREGRDARSSEFNWREVMGLRRDRLLSRHCLISFALFLVVAQLIAALSVYTVETVGISRAQLGVLYAINGFMVVFFQFPISSYFKKMPLTRQLALGSIIYAAGYMTVGFATGFIFLIICMVIITIAEMIVSPTSLTLVANLSPPDGYGQYMGIYGFFQMSGWSLGPTLGGILLDVFRLQPILMWGTVAMLAVVAAILFLDFGRRLTPYLNSGHQEEEETAYA